MNLSGDNITAIIISGFGVLQSIGIALIVRRTRRIREKVDVVDQKVTGVASAVGKVHALVDSQHSELKGELKTYKEFTDQAFNLVVTREGKPPNATEEP